MALTRTSHGTYHSCHVAMMVKFALKFHSLMSRSCKAAYKYKWIGISPSPGRLGYLESHFIPNTKQEILVISYTTSSVNSFYVDNSYKKSILYITISVTSIAIHWRHYVPDISLGAYTLCICLEELDYWNLLFPLWIM